MEKLDKRGITYNSGTSTAVAVVLDALSIEDWHKHSKLSAALEPILLKLGARYIYIEKKRGKALDPVANFHVRNGAIFERINWLADPSRKVRSQPNRLSYTCILSSAICLLVLLYAGNCSKCWDDDQLQV